LLAVSIACDRDLANWIKNQAEKDWKKWRKLLSFLNFNFFKNTLKKQKTNRPLILLNYKKNINLVWLNEFSVIWCLLLKIFFLKNNIFFIKLIDLDWHGNFPMDSTWRQCFTLQETMAWKIVRQHQALTMEEKAVGKNIHYLPRPNWYFKTTARWQWWIRLDFIEYFLTNILLEFSTIFIILVSWY